MLYYLCSSIATSTATSSSSSRIYLASPLAAEAVIGKRNRGQRVEGMPIVKAISDGNRQENLLFKLVAIIMPHVDHGHSKKASSSCNPKTSMACNSLFFLRCKSNCLIWLCSLIAYCSFQSTSSIYTAGLGTSLVSVLFFSSFQQASYTISLSCFIISSSLGNIQEGSFQS